MRGNFGGRPRGQVAPPSRHSVNRLLLDGGLLPIEVMVSSMRWFMQESERAWHSAEAERDKEKKEELLNSSMALRRSAIYCAKEAAPFMHPRMAHVTHDAKEGTPFIIQLDAVDSGL